MLSVIVPASDEAGVIARCLLALFASGPMDAEAIVVANGCVDDTAAAARSLSTQASAAGWRLVVIELREGNKPAALNAGDAAARGDKRVYLDADVVVSPGLMAQIDAALQRPQATYASGTPIIPPAASAVTRAYARFWYRLPFTHSNAPGYGLFAVNAAGRARWSAFPELRSDDTFARLQFTPSERVQCPATYAWPMSEGFRRLARVRRRQDAGLAEISRLYPGLRERSGKRRVDRQALLALALEDPTGVAAYAAVTLAVRLGRNSGAWARGR